MMIYTFETEVAPEWVDYNGHMRDAFYGLVFSYAVDQFMVEIGIDEAYRNETKGTIYVVEDHTFYLDEVKGSDSIHVETVVLDQDPKRIHLRQSIIANGKTAAVCESMQLHISQAGETPRTAAMPDHIQTILKNAQLTPEQIAPLTPRANAIGIRRK